MDIGAAILAYVVPLGLCVVGAGLLAVSVLSRRTERRRRTRGAVARGRVVGSERVRPRQSGAGIAHALDLPVISFVDRDGVERTFREQIGANLPVQVGREVEVWYDPDDLDAPPVVLGSGSRAALDVVQGGLGLVVLLVGVAWMAASVS